MAHCNDKGTFTQSHHQRDRREEIAQQLIVDDHVLVLSIYNQ